jgi:hypothetical protein
MRKLLFLVLLLIFSNSFSQNKKYHFSSEKTIEIKKAYHTEGVYVVSKQKIFIPKFDTIKSFTAEYIEEIKENEKQMKDSLKAVEDFKLQNSPNAKLNWTRKTKGQIKSMDGTVKEIKKFNISYKLIDIDGYVRKDEIDASKLNGEFVVIDDCEFVFENKSFAKNQIILKSNAKNIKDNNNFSYSDVLIWNATTNEYYTTSFNTLNRLAIIEDEKHLFYENLKKNGFKTKQIYGDVCIVMPNKFIKINNNLSEKLQKTGIIYLTNLSKSLDNYHQLATIAKPLVERINGYVGAYRYGTLTATRLAQWKIDNKQAQIIANKFKLIKEIDEAYFDDYLAINYDDYFVHKNQQIKIALDTAILVSNQLLGM